jgi:hypothetical protein
MIAAILTLLLATTGETDPSEVLEEGARSQMSRFVAKCLSTTDALQCLGDLSFVCIPTDYTNSGQNYVCDTRLTITMTEITNKPNPVTHENLFDFHVIVSQSATGWTSDIQSVDLVKE